MAQGSHERFSELEAQLLPADLLAEHRREPYFLIEAEELARNGADQYVSIPISEAFQQRYLAEVLRIAGVQESEDPLNIRFLLDIEHARSIRPKFELIWNTSDPEDINKLDIDCMWESGIHRRERVTVGATTLMITAFTGDKIASPVSLQSLQYPTSDSSIRARFLYNYGADQRDRDRHIGLAEELLGFFKPITPLSDL